MIERWNHFWFRSVSPVPLALVRIGFALAALANWALLWSDRRSFLLPGGVQMRDFIDEAAQALTVLNLFESSAAIHIFLFCGLFAIICLGLGFYTRLASIAVFVFILSYIPAFGPMASGWDYLQCTIAFILMLSPCSAALSLDARGRPPEGIPVYPQKLLQWQFMLMFVTTAWLKSAAPIWRDGVESGHFLLGGYSNVHTPFLLRLPMLNMVLTHLTLFIELTVPFLLWHRRTRALGYFGLIGLMAIIGTSKVFVYALTVMALSLCFLEAADLERLAEARKLPARARLKLLGRALVSGVTGIFAARSERDQPP